MKLTECEPEFLRVNDASHYRRVGSLQIADGILFYCPKCRKHSILAWFHGRKLPKSLDKGDVRWNVYGSDFSNLTLQPERPMVYQCGWNGSIRQGTL